MDEKPDDDKQNSFERWGIAPAAFFLVALAGAVFLLCWLLANLWPGAGRPDYPGFPLGVLLGTVWTVVALVLAWLLRN